MDQACIASRAVQRCRRCSCCRCSRSVLSREHRSRSVLTRAERSWFVLSRERRSWFVPLLFTVRSRARTRSEPFTVCSTSVLLEHSVHRSFSFDAHCSRQHQWSYSIIAVTGCKRFCGIDSALSEHSIAVDDGYGIGVCVCHQRAEIVVDIAERLW